MATRVRRPHTSEMTFWSRYDPVILPAGNTDHWSKMKIKALTISPPSSSYETNRYQFQGNGTMKSTPGKSFDSMLRDSFNNNIPGGYNKSRPNSTAWRERLKSSFSTRAKEGFQYWLIERPKPTSFGRYGIGSHKTVLGIGNAPRT